MKKIIMSISLVCAMCILLSSCGSMLEYVIERTLQPTVETAPTATPETDPPETSNEAAEPERQAPQTSAQGQEASQPQLLPLPQMPAPQPDPQPDPEAEAEAQRLEFSERWKRIVFEGARRFHEDLVQGVPEKQETFGEWHDFLHYSFRVLLFDAVSDTPNVIFVDDMYGVYMQLSSLYEINGGRLEEIVTAQWIEPLENTVASVRDMVAATWTGGGTWSETRYYKHVGGHWRQESFIYNTGGGQFFSDEATGEYSEDWDEVGRLLDDRLKGYEYPEYEDLHIIGFDYATTEGRPIPWSQIAPELSAYLDAYDGININVS